MDGALITSGSTDLGGVFVSAGVEWSQVKTGFDQIRNYIADFESRYGSITIEILPDVQGFAESMQGLRQIIREKPMTVGLQLDQAQFATQAQQAANTFGLALSNAANQAVLQIAEGMQAAMSNLHLPNASPGAAGAPGGGGGGGAGRGRQPWYMANLARPASLFRAFGAPVAAFYGIEAAFEMAKGISEASYVAAHPEIQLEQLSRPGTGLGLGSNSAIRDLALQNTDIDRILAGRKTVQEIPLLGQILRASDIGDGSTFFWEKQRERNVAMAGGIGSAEEGKLSARIESAEIKGDTAQAVRIQRQAKIDGLTEKLTDATARADKDWYAKQPGIARIGANPEEAAIMEQIDAESVNMRQVVARAAQIQGATRTARFQSAFATDIRTQALRGEFETGGQFRSLQLRHLAETEELGSRQQLERQSARPDELESIKAKQGSDQKRLRAEQNREDEEAEQRRGQVILSARSTADQAILREAGYFHDAELSALRAAQQRELDEMKGGTEKEKDAVRQKYGALAAESNSSDARRTTSALAVIHASAANAALTVQQAGMEISLDPRGAAMLQFQQERNNLDAEETKIAQLPANQRAAARDEIRKKREAIDARERLQQFRFGRQDQGAMIGLGASITSSQFLQHDMPESAEAAGAIGAAKLAIQQAQETFGKDSVVTAATQQAQIEHLKAIRHEMVDPHGGEFALRSGHGAAGAFTLLAESRLGNRGNDLAAVEKMLTAAIKELTAQVQNQNGQNPKRGNPGA